MYRHIKRKIKQIRKRGFTLIEIIIVIVIIGLLTALVVGNLITSLKKSRDTRRKSDLDNIRSALEIYYEDNRRYPVLSEFTAGNNRLCIPVNDCSIKVYMEKVPKDPLTKQSYGYETDEFGSYYKLYANLENKNDLGQGVNQAGFANLICNPNPCKYGVASPNSRIDTTETAYTGGAVGTGETTPTSIPSPALSLTPTSIISGSGPTIVPLTSTPTPTSKINPSNIPPATDISKYVEGEDGTWCYKSDSWADYSIYGVNVDYSSQGFCIDRNGVHYDYCDGTVSSTYYCGYSWNGATQKPRNVICFQGGYGCASSYDGSTCIGGACSPPITTMPTPILHTADPNTKSLIGGDGTWCYDSDGNGNDFVKGSCQDNSGLYYDYCFGKKGVQDYYCFGKWNGLTYFDVKCIPGSHACTQFGYDKVCKDAVCIKVTPTPTPTEPMHLSGIPPSTGTSKYNEGSDGSFCYDFTGLSPVFIYDTGLGGQINIEYSTSNFCIDKSGTFRDYCDGNVHRSYYCSASNNTNWHCENGGYTCSYYNDSCTNNHCSPPLSSLPTPIQTSTQPALKTLTGSDGSFCYDSDGNGNLREFGTCQDNAGLYNDYCDGTNYIHDYHCVGIWNGSSYTKVKCEAGTSGCKTNFAYICSNGKCIAPPK